MTDTSLIFNLIARDQASATFDKLSGIAAGVGVAVGAALTAGVAQALELDAAKAKFTAQLGSPEFAEELGGVAGNLYTRGFGASVEESMAAVKASLDAGLVLEDDTPEAIEEITRKAQALATTFDQDVSATARAAGQMIRTGLASDADEALDILTRGFQQTGDQAGDLLDTFSEYSTQFRELGISGEKAMGLLTQGVKAGARDIDTVADAIKEFAIRSKDGSAGSAAAFKALGFNAKEMFQTFAAGGPKADQAMLSVLQKLKEIKDPVQQNTQAVALFGTKAEDLGDALFALDPTKAVDALGQVEGAAGKMADALENSASNQLASFKREAEKALVEQLAKAIPYLKSAAGFLREHREIVEPLIGVLTGLALAIGAIIIATKLWTAAQTALSIAMSANPVGLIIIAIVALAGVVYLLIDNWDAVSAWWSNLWAGISAWFIDTWHSILGFIQGIPGAIMGFISALPGMLWDLITNMLTTAAFLVGYGIGAVVRFFIELPGNIWAAMQAAPGIVWNILTTMWNKGRDLVSSGVSKAIDIIKGIPGLIADVGPQIIKGLINGVNSAVGALWDLAKKMASKFLDGFKSALKISSPSRVMAEEVAPAIISGLTGGLDDGSSAVTAAGGRLAGAVMPAVPLSAGLVRSGGPAGPITLILRGDGEIVELLIKLLREAIRDRGGDPVVVLSGGR